VAALPRAGVAGLPVGVPTQQAHRHGPDPTTRMKAPSSSFVRLPKGHCRWSCGEHVAEHINAAGRGPPPARRRLWQNRSASLAGNAPEASASVVLAECATWQEKPWACLARASTAQHRFLNKAPSPGRFDADADACGGQQAEPEQPLACVVLVLHPETGAKPRFLAVIKSPPVLNQKFTNSRDSPQ